MAELDLNKPTRFLITLLWIVMTGATVQAAPKHSVHPDLADLSIHWLAADTMTIDRYSIDYELARQDMSGPASGYTQAFVEQVMTRATVRLLRFITNKGLPIARCSAKHLDIYVVSHATLNNHNRFRDWGLANGVKNRNTFALWALYDPMRSQPERASILLTTRTQWANEILLAHELAHYWYDQFCLALSWFDGTESFALAFQAVYEAEMAQR